ncbi:hypothetical protein C7C56_011325 [Massilia glaciei]|uniref:Uncharacterized protein n=1 Tax=Massilia glaciei TaxID=1524097 RepID=A0A2U2HM17_9BURK|nr:hypothetical protein C7C56_011325 [Massilia glaciei]
MLPAAEIALPILGNKRHNVIPAKAGTHAELANTRSSSLQDWELYRSKFWKAHNCTLIMGPRFRGNDVVILNDVAYFIDEEG